MRGSVHAAPWIQRPVSEGIVPTHGRDAVFSCPAHLPAGPSMVVSFSGANIASFVPPSCRFFLFHLHLSSLGEDGVLDKDSLQRAHQRPTGQRRALQRLLLLWGICSQLRHQRLDPRRPSSPRLLLFSLPAREIQLTIHEIASTSASSTSRMS